MEKEFLENLMEDKKIDVRTYSPLVLAYMGDAVFEMFVRTKLVTKCNAPVNTLHKESKKYVKASEQAKIFGKIESLLTEEEIGVFKRGRNAKSHTVPKHAELMDYKTSTGIEALIGYLYLQGNMARIIELVNIGIE